MCRTEEEIIAMADEADAITGITPYHSFSDAVLEKTSKIPCHHRYRNRLEYRRPSCFFINTARGGCVDQDALVRVLSEHLIAGAGIDVTIDEPISPENPLLGLPNIILSGHSAYYSIPSDKECHGKPMTQVVQALKGDWPIYAVNPDARAQWENRWGKK